MVSFPTKARDVIGPARRAVLAVLMALVSLPFAAALARPQSKTNPNTFESLSKAGDAARDENRLDEAVGFYKKALALRPNWAEGWWSLGTIEYDRNNYRAAAAAFRKLLPLAPKNGTAYAMLGLSEFELGQDDLALQHIERAKQLEIATDPQLRRVVLYHDGILLMRKGTFLAAQRPLGELCQTGMPNQDVVNALGLAVFRILPVNAPPAASPGAQTIARAGHAECLTVQKRYDEARKEYEALVAEYPKYPNMHYVFGKFLVEASDTAGAVAEFKKEIENNPKDIPSRLEIAATEYKVNSAAGIPYAEQAVALDPRLPFGHYLLGLLYLDVDQYQKAIPHLEAAEKAFPKDAKIYFALGSAYSRAGRRLEAEKARLAYQRLSQESAADAGASY